jgi:uncharacterized protein
MDLIRYTHALSRFRWLVLAASVLTVAGLAGGLGRLTVSTDFDIYFSDDNPQMAAFERFERVFTNQDSLSFLVLTEPGEALSPTNLSLIHGLTERAWRLPYARRVDSIANYPYTQVDGDWLETDDLILDPAAPPADLVEILEREPGLSGRLVSRDLSAMLVSVSLALPHDEAEGNLAAVTEARALRDEFVAANPDVTILVGGSSATNVTLTEAVEEDVSRLVTLSYGIILICLALLLRSVLGTVGILGVITLSIVGTMGLFGWFGYTLSPVTGFVPSMVMTMAVADSVHVLVTWSHERRQGLDPVAAMAESMRVNAQPVFLTSLTTVIGVLSLNFSDSPPYRDMGNMVAVGVTLAWLFTMTFLPAFMMVFPGKVTTSGIAHQEHPLTRLSDWVVRWRKALLIGLGLLTVTLAGFVTRNQLTERWNEYFSDSFEVRRAMDAGDERLAGIHAMHFILDSGSPDGINDPAYLAEVDAFAGWLESRPGVGSVSTLAETIRSLNRKFNADDPAYDVIPDDRRLVAQYLLLYELSLPQGMGLDTTINVDRSATRATLIHHRTDSETLLALERESLAWLADNAPHIQAAEVTGLDMMFAHINHRNIRATLKGIALALLLISGVLVIALRSVRLGLLSMVPNFAPVLIAYGLWGIMVGRVDLAISIVSALSLGIVVDDTVHFISKYRRAVVEKSLSATEGVRYAFRTVGVALIITTTVLVAGFSTLGFSAFNPSRETGLLLAMTLSIALVMDLLLLPPLLTVFGPRQHHGSD